MQLPAIMLGKICGVLVGPIWTQGPNSLGAAQPSEAPQILCSVGR